jgi:hypothetical protein
MSTTLVIRKVLVSILLLALVLPPFALATTGEVLTNENILSLLRWKAKPQEIVAVIERNETRFDFSAESLSRLKEAGVSSKVLDAMWQATLKATTGSVPSPTTKRTSLTDEPATDCDEATTEPDSQRRLDEARRVKAAGTETLCKDAKLDERCFLEEKPGSGKLEKAPRYNVDLDWKTGSVSPSCVDHSGRYCFALHNVNNVLYSYGFTVNRIEPQGSDFDLLKDAIGKITKLFGGASAAEKKGEEAKAKLIECPTELVQALEHALAAAEALRDVISQLDPGKDANGRPISVPLATTLSKWPNVPPKFIAFEKAIAELVKQLNRLTDPSLCEKNCVLAKAEALVLDVYRPARGHYLELCSRVNSQHVARYLTDLEATNAYNVVVKEHYGDQPTSAEAKIFHLDACRKILVSSAGFLLTQLQARSYLSRTVPDMTDPTKTQNVLGVDGGGNPRIALMALLNYNLPWQRWRNGGFAISAGPVFDVSNGKADTSRFGFFGGGSVHLWNRLFLTPGVHVGEFADFPQGFSKPGDVIPDKTGTPNPVKRWTARFAFGISFKVSELGFGGGGSDDSTKKPASSQPKP